MPDHPAREQVNDTNTPTMYSWIRELTSAWKWMIKMTAAAGPAAMIAGDGAGGGVLPGCDVYQPTGRVAEQLWSPARSWSWTAATGRIPDTTSDFRTS